MGNVLQNMNSEQFCEQYGRDMDSVRIKLRRIMPGVPFDRSAELSPDVLAKLFMDGRRKSDKKPAPKKQAPKKEPKEKPTKTEQTEEQTEWPMEQERPWYKSALLIALLIG